MKKNGKLYTAKKGSFIVRKADGFVMGTDIDLGSADSIENYEEREYTQEEYDAYCKKVGIKNHDSYTPTKRAAKVAE